MTSLFTDVEGSTRLREQQTEQMGRALARHDETLRSAIDRNEGFVFTRAGDSFAAAFRTARDGVLAATEAQCRLRREPWPESTPIHVRMGLHTGIAGIRDGDHRVGGHVVSEPEQDAVERICARLDGMPLAIELDTFRPP